MEAHKRTDGVRKKNENCPQEQTGNYKNLIGRDPNVKSLAKRMPARISLGSEKIKLAHKMQMFNVIDSKYLFKFSMYVAKNQSPRY